HLFFFFLRERKGQNFNVCHLGYNLHQVMRRVFFFFPSFFLISCCVCALFIEIS
ncbi:unnamed protein product, partial [Musa textilis]